MVQPKITGDGVGRPSHLFGFNLTADEWWALLVNDAGALITGAGPGAGFYEAYIHIQDQKSAGTDGGTFTGGAWRTRVLTHELHDTGDNAVLDGNQITLQAGVYRVHISCIAHYVIADKSRLYNVTDGATILVSPNGRSQGLWAQHLSVIVGRFTIPAGKALEVQHYCHQTRATDGFGLSYSPAGEVEVYLDFEAWKEA